LPLSAAEKSRRHRTRKSAAGSVGNLAKQLRLVKHAVR
jgi:hypothetical protein